jgi:hypothetical protein
MLWSPTWKRTRQSPTRKRYSGGVNALEFFHVAGAGFSKALNGSLHATGNALVERRQILQRGLGPFDLSHSSPVTLIPTGA